MAEETSRGGRSSGYALGSGSGGGAGYGFNSGGGCGICGESGHSLSDCKSGDSLFLQKGERVYKACYNCSSIDHLARECNHGRGGGGACYTCGGQGHLARECPSGGGACYTCGGQGHLARECPEVVVVEGWVEVAVAVENDKALLSQELEKE